jgi:hypothetical protein
VVEPVASLVERAKELSPEQLALLSLYSRRRSERPDAEREQAPFERSPRDEEVLARLHELSDAEVDSLLQQVLAEEDAPAAEAEPEPRPSVIPAARRDESELLARIDRLSDDEVDSLLGELLEGET